MAKTRKTTKEAKAKLKHSNLVSENMTSKRYSSVSDYLESISDDNPELSSSTDEQIESRQIVKALIHLRVSNSDSQTDLAEKLGCSQSRISKIENGFDQNLKLKDLEDYGRVFGKDITLLVSDRSMGLADRVKFHAFGVRKALMKLVELAHKDDEIAKGVAQLHIEALVNIARFIRQTAGKLPAPSDDEEVEEIIRIFGYDDCEEEAPEPVLDRENSAVKV